MKLSHERHRARDLGGRYADLAKDLGASNIASALAADGVGIGVGAKYNTKATFVISLPLSQDDTGKLKVGNARLGINHKDEKGVDPCRTAVGRSRAFAKHYWGTAFNRHRSHWIGP